MSVADPALLPLTRPGEVVRALCRAQPAIAGREDWARPPRPRRARRLLARASMAVLDTAAGNPPTPRWLGRAADRALGGTAARGADGSLAWQLRQSLHGSPRRYLLVTDRRILVLTREGGGYAALLELTRDQVVGARPAAWFLQRGRIAVEFADGSMLTVVLGLLTRRSVEPMLAALRPVH